MTPILRAVLAAALLVWLLGASVISIILFRRRAPNLSDAGGSAMLGPTIRGWHFDNLRPVEEFLVRRNVRPAVLSYLQLAVAAVVGLAYAEGLVIVAGWLVLSGGSLDILDGRVARRTNRGSRQGAFLDSLIDRYADSFAYLGLAAFFIGSWVLWAVFLALVGGLMVSYARARAEGLGTRCNVGLLQRPERYVILGLGSVFGSLIEHATGWHPGGQEYPVVVASVVALAVLSNITAVHRAVHVMRQLGGPAHG